MAKVVCESCGTEFLYGVVKGLESCPVCGNPLWGEEEKPKAEDEHPDWITWYYYGYKSDNGKTAYLDDSPIDLTEHGDTFFLIKEFKAPPESEYGLDEVKRILRTYVPDAFSPAKNAESDVRCPRCGSTQIQMVPRKFSILTGFATNRLDRVCVRCNKKF